MIDRLCVFATKTASGLVICNAPLNGPQGTEEAVIQAGCGQRALAHECTQLKERQRRVKKGEEDPAKNQKHPPYIENTFSPKHGKDDTNMGSVTRRGRKRSR